MIEKVENKIIQWNIEILEISLQDYFGTLLDLMKYAIKNSSIPFISIAL